MNKKLIFLIFVFNIFTNLTISVYASGNLKYRILKFNKNIFLTKNYSKEEIKNFEKKLKIKIPKLAKKIYIGKYNIKELIFVAETKYNIKIDNIITLFEELELRILHVKKYCSSVFSISKTLIPFGNNDYGDSFFIDNDCIWYNHHECENFIKFKLILE